MALVEADCHDDGDWRNHAFVEPDDLVTQRCLSCHAVVKNAGLANRELLFPPVLLTVVPKES